ncbi:cytotoxic and regulatory T-cell molecule-like isoform X1 [Oncorhynchus tshawytscha]|uniref:cytotoxic and regulatory T-cell molecule-like isoform X1 n=2 Tax=Oncorhynchus tshawytscha TaxID=74940 RepID=UPI000D0A157F|nr:cytotoxic and regulatory T-cell molecule-like isoform X1 [Oncorhynchus tshawytscha]
MALMLQLCFLVLFVRGSIAVQHLTVMEGETLTMKCRIRNAEGSHVEWKNPDGHVMFFNNQKALKDKRYKIINLSDSVFSVSVSDVTFKDGGLYTCLHYIHKVPVVKWVNVTVLGKPKLEITEHNGKTAIKCSAVGNGHPPKISWLLESGLEMYAQPQYLLDKNTYSSLDILHVQSYKRRVTLKCIVRHPALHNSSLMNFVKIGQNPTEESHSTTRASHWLSTGLTEVTTTASRWHSTQVSTETPTATALNWPITEGSPASTPDLQLSTHNWLSVSQTTENTPHNGTGHNSSNAKGSFFNDTETQKGTGRSALLLIFLVTGLILGLLVVVSLFVIKLRRAHILWKKVLIITENDDSDQSVESNRSKSSNEEKQSRGRRGNGLFNIRFTKYVVEEPMATETMTTTNIKTEEDPEIQVIPQKNGATQSPQIKEREL